MELGYKVLVYNLFYGIPPVHSRVIAYHLIEAAIFDPEHLEVVSAKNLAVRLRGGSPI